jgi:hypothetical protein
MTVAGLPYPLKAKGKVREASMLATHHDRRDRPTVGL